MGASPRDAVVEQANTGCGEGPSLGPRNIGRCLEANLFGEREGPGPADRGFRTVESHPDPAIYDLM